MYCGGGRKILIKIFADFIATPDGQKKDLK